MELSRVSLGGSVVQDQPSSGGSLVCASVSSLSRWRGSDLEVGRKAEKTEGPGSAMKSINQPTVMILSF